MLSQVKQRLASKEGRCVDSLFLFLCLTPCLPLWRPFTRFLASLPPNGGLHPLTHWAVCLLPASTHLLLPCPQPAAHPGSSLC